MAQPIIINPGPARYKMAEGVALGRAGEAVADDVAQMFMLYAQHKEKEKEDKLKLQLALAKQFGFKTFGEPFAKSMEQSAGSQLFPRDQSGNIVLPKTETEREEERIRAQYPDAPDKVNERLDQLHGYVKPDPSQVEVQVHKDTEAARDRREQAKETAANIRTQMLAGARITAEEMRGNRDWHNKQSPLTLYKGVLVPYDARTLRKDPGAVPLTNGEADFIMRYNKYSTDRRGAQLRNRGLFLKNEVEQHKLLDMADDITDELAKTSKIALPIARYMASKAAGADPAKANGLMVAFAKTVLQHKLDANGNRKYTDKDIEDKLRDQGFVDTLKDHTGFWGMHFGAAHEGGLSQAGETKAPTTTPKGPLDPQSEADQYLGGQ
jgi:hypothetical protein